MRTSWTLWGHWWLWWPIEDYLRNWVLWGHFEDFQNILRTWRPFWGHFEKLLRTFCGSVQDLSWNCGSEKLWTLSCFWGLSRNLGTLRTFRGSEDLLRTCGIWEYFENVLRTLMTFWGYEDFVDPLRTLMSLMTYWGLFKVLSTVGTFWRLSEHLEDFEAILRTFWVTFEDFLRIFSVPFLELWTWEPVDFELFLRTF